MKGQGVLRGKDLLQNNSLFCTHAESINTLACAGLNAAETVLTTAPFYSRKETFLNSIYDVGLDC